MIKVLQSGFYSTIQDLGRFGYQDYGVPYSGVMDKQAATIANTLLGNHENNAVLEITMTGPKLKFECDTLICLSGASMNPQINKKYIPNNKIFNVKKDDVLSFGKLDSGFRCYLAVLGGFNAEMVMNSRSMYQNITQQSSIKKGDQLAIKNSTFNYKMHHSNLRVNTSYIDNLTLEVYRGPEFKYLSVSNQKKILSSRFTISKYNNRMAYQLEEVLANNLDSIITAPVLPGTIQLTPSGKLIILMKDCQTTGGYPRVLQLSESAIHSLAQKITGDKLQFKCL